MRRQAVVTMAVAAGTLLVGCSGHPSSNGRSASVSVSPEQAAHNAAEFMVDATILPRGARRYSGPLPIILQQRHGDIGHLTNLVSVRRVWTVPEPPDSLRRFDFAPPRHPPNWGGGGASFSTADGHAWLYMTNYFTNLPLNVAVAWFDVAITGDVRGGSVIRADGVASWTPPKRAAEYVPADDHVATIETLNPSSPTKVDRRVVVTDPKRFAALAATYNRIRLQAIGLSGECGMNPVVVPSLGMSAPFGTITTIAFSHDTRSKPNLIAGPTCFGIGVRAAGTIQPLLQSDPAFWHLVQGALAAHANREKRAA